MGRVVEVTELGVVEMATVEVVQDTGEEARAEEEVVMVMEAMEVKAAEAVAEVAVRGGWEMAEVATPVCTSRPWHRSLGCCVSWQVGPRCHYTTTR